MADEGKKFSRILNPVMEYLPANGMRFPISRSVAPFDSLSVHFSEIRIKSARYWLDVLTPRLVRNSALTEQVEAREGKGDGGSGGIGEAGLAEQNSFGQIKQSLAICA
jgi:hypothetical protein